MKYADYSVEDLASDSFFIRWVKYKDEESDWFWTSFLKEYPDKAETVYQAKSLLKQLASSEAVLDQSSFGAMRNRLQMAIREEKEHEQVPRRTIQWNNFIKLVAVLALVPFSFLLYLKLSSTAPVNNNAASADVPTDSLETRENPHGQKSIFLLPDGSKVWLNAGSKLVYSRDFRGHHHRQVYLEGEAYFEVVHNPSVPFYVQTASAIRVEVLGTSFNVRSYPDDQTVETTLVEGKVSIDRVKANGAKPENLVLYPNQRAIYEKQTDILNVEDIQSKKITAWRHEQLVFNEAPFNEVFTQLERWYNVKIHVENKDILQCGLTANIQDESLENVLRLLETTHQIEYKIIENEVFIYKIRCTQ